MDYQNYKMTKADTLFLIIDIQEKLSRVMPEAEKVLETTRKMSEIAEIMEIPVVLTEQYPKGLGKTLEPILSALKEPRSIEKTSFSALTPELTDILQKHGRRQILIVGIETHICVFQTCRDLIAKGYLPVILSDGVTSRTAENKQNGLELIREMGGVISNLETVVYDLLECSGTDLFKKIAPYFK